MGKNNGTAQIDNAKDTFPLSSGVTGAATVFTADATTNALTSVAHGLTNGMVVYFTTTGTLPAPLVADTAYYVINATTNTYKVALTSGGAAIDLTDTGSGTHSFSGAGTISTGNAKNHIIGVGTNFLTIPPGSWLFVPDEDVLAKIGRVTSNTSLYLVDELTDTFSGVPFRITPKSGYTLVSFLVEGGTAVIDGTTLSENTTNSFESSGRGAVDPMIVDATGSKVIFTYQT